MKCLFEAVDSGPGRDVTTDVATHAVGNAVQGTAHDWKVFVH
jgi:hypothetical protein